ncbi:MAG: DUF1761 domain-containing protein [Actinomycetota bacterium]
MDLGDVNWFAVLVAVISHQIIGFLWYGPLFSKTWLSAMGKQREDVQGGMDASMIWALIASAVSAVGIALLLTMTDDPSTGLGIVVGLVAALSFAGATTFTETAFEERKPLLSALFTGYALVGYAVMGALIGAWQ